MTEIDREIALSVVLSEDVHSDLSHLSDVTSWHGHTAFAGWLIGVLNPGSLVELGTHRGDSYFTFCQAVRQHGGKTQCFAVDTWLGDPHAGYYGDEVYQEVERYNSENFGDFSTLLRREFDSALEVFADGTLDLVHIDGLHTYEAVSHDFEAWRPKLSEKGVILFHDIAVRRDDFGVWKLWDEVAQRYPAFDFHHCNGLGLLCVGDSVPGMLLDLCSSSDIMKNGVRSIFQGLGERNAYRRTAELATATSGELKLLEELTKTVVEERRLMSEDQERIRLEREIILEERQTLLKQLEEAGRSLGELLESQAANSQQLSQEVEIRKLAEYELELSAHRIKELAEERNGVLLKLLDAEQEACGSLEGSAHWVAKMDYSSMKAERDRLFHENRSAVEDRNRMEGERDEAVKQALAIENAFTTSTSWRATAPLRRLTRILQLIP